jgi:hypothetical protein
MRIAASKYVLRLHKTIYGLKQSSRKWYENLTTALATLGFTPLETDHAIFKFVQDDNIIILAVHVDDCVIIGSSPSLILDMQDHITQLFKVTFLGPIS